MPNLSDYNSQTRYNSRIAQANADQQAAQHQAQVQLNQSTGQTIGQTDPLTGKSTFQTAASVPTNALLKEAQTVYERQKGETTVYIPGQNGQIGQAANLGQIQLNADQRLLANGFNPTLALNQVTSNGYKQGVQGAFNGVGHSVIDTSNLKPLTTAGVQETQQEFEARKASIEQQNAALEAQKTQKQTQARNKAASNSASTAAGANQQFSSVEDLVDHYRKQGTDEQSIRGLVDQYNQQKAPSPEQQGQAAGIESLIATLTPEQRQYLEPMLRAQMQAINQSNALAGATFGNDMQVAKDNFDTTNAQLQAAADMNVKLQKDLDEISQQMRDSSLENIAKQQKVNEERLQWEQTKRERDLKNEERKAVDRKIGEMALIGGFGSYASGQIVDEVRNNFESAISDLSIEFGLQRSESAVRFSAQHNDVMNQYRADSINSLSALTAKLEQIGGQFASNKIAKTNAEKKAWDDFVKVHDGNSKRAADLMSDTIGMIRKDILDERQTKAKAEQESYDRSWDKYKFETERLYKEQDYAMRAMDKQETLDIRRDDKEKYNAQTQINLLQNQIEGNDVFVQYRNAKMSFDAIEAAFSDNSNPFRDRALAKSYEKLVESNSVVMPGEYEDIAQNIPLASKILGSIERVKNGGQKWTEDERVALKDISKKLFSSYEKRRELEAQKFLSAIDFHNKNTQNPNYRLSPEMFNLPVTSTTGQRIRAESLAPAGLFPSVAPGGGEEDSAGNNLGEFGRVTQNYSTPVKAREDGGLYSQGTVSAWGGKHAGVDYAMPEGTRLPSVVDGEIVSIGESSGWGKTVVIRDPNGAEHRYSHLSDFAPGLEKGVKVQRGQYLARSGNTGNSTGPHLDYRIRYQGRYVDPFSYKSHS